MDPSLWQQISEAFIVAQETPAAERPHYLATLPKHIRTEVESLLRANDAAGPFLEHEEDWLAPGAVLDRYTIEARVARGGMGEVYRASRGEGGEQRVAIKVLSPIFATRDSTRLFARERRILAQLSHPDVVTLIDGGECNGRHYLVMEWVDGKPLNLWAPHVPLADRLALLERICGAVHSAHQNLIVHCDLKPSNILVTPRGEPKLLDFGIARLLSATGDLPAATRTTLRALTLNYASPEQARDLPAGIPSDIYSLGLILCEILSGRLAQPVEGLPLDQAIAAITGKDPDLDSALPQDLIAIARKATAKEPARRYASANEFAADLARYREGYPILARHPTIRYQALKFVKRNRAAVAAGAVGLCLALAALGAFAMQYRRAGDQRRLAERRFQVAREMAQLMVFDGPARLAKVPGTLDTRRWMTENATAYLERLAADIQGDESLALIVAQGYRQVAHQQFNFNMSHLNEPAAALTALERGARVLEALPHPTPKQIEELIANRLARPYLVLRQQQQALANEDAAENLATALDAQGHPGHRDIHARVHYMRASNFDRPAAERLAIWRQLEAYYARRLAELTSDPERIRNLALVQKSISDVLGFQKQWVPALDYANRALAFDERRLSMNPDDRNNQMDIAFDLGRIGQLFGESGRPAEAIPYLRRSLDIRRGLADADPADLRAQERLAWMLGELGRRLLATGEQREGVADIRQALVIRSRLNAPGAGLNSTPDLHALLAAEADRTGDKATACHEWRAAARTLPTDTSSANYQPVPVQTIRDRAAGCPL